MRAHPQTRRQICWQDRRNFGNFCNQLVVGVSATQADRLQAFPCQEDMGGSEPVAARQPKVPHRQPVANGRCTVPARFIGRGGLHPPHRLQLRRHPARHSAPNGPVECAFASPVVHPIDRQKSWLLFPRGCMEGHLVSWGDIAPVDLVTISFSGVLRDTMRRNTGLSTGHSVFPFNVLVHGNGTSVEGLGIAIPQSQAFSPARDQAGSTTHPTHQSRSTSRLPVRAPRTKSRVPCPTPHDSNPDPRTRSKDRSTPPWPTPGRVQPLV